MAIAESQKMNYWDVARFTKLPGASVDVIIDPSYWTVRIKNAVKRMISNREIVGYGMASRLAKNIAAQHELVTSVYHTNNIYSDNVPDEKRQELVNVMTADFASFRMSDKATAYSIASRGDSLKNNVDRLIKHGSVSYYFMNNYFAKEARLIIQTPPSIEEQAIIADIHAALNRNETYTFTTY